MVEYIRAAQWVLESRVGYWGLSAVGSSPAFSAHWSVNYNPRLAVWKAWGQATNNTETLKPPTLIATAVDTFKS